LSNVIASQVDLHAQTGGVVPEVAAREHILKIIPVLDEALKKAGCDFDSIDAVAVTKGPGLISSLIIGTEAASVISYLKDKPLIPVHHIIGHIYANFLSDETDAPIFPVLVLTVSGGHNEIILMREHGDFVILGETRDDAAGEAFDKVARILGLGYPGGPAVSKAAIGGNREAFKLPRSYLEEGSLDFSFSGLKTAVLHEVKKYLAAQAQAQAHAPTHAQALAQAPALVKDLSASFQEAAVDVLTDKLIQAYLNLLDEGTLVREIHLAGGVSANSRLREVLTHKARVFDVRGLDVKIRFPKSLTYCTDNAAMIAAAAYALYKKSPESYKKASNIIPTTSFDLFGVLA
ncbi:MAG: tRNA (adenosine(37)-N6)-threonylcarbamoyltransferase complex transferase subunit TsaD, partial [Candidatus Gracilibacteria bacterium]